MKVYGSREIRNVALIGHGDSGKTTLASAMLYLAGAVNRLGRVEDGNTVTDYDEDEIARQITINTAVAHCEWGSSKINIIDTPGYPAFILDAKSSLMGADSALLVVDSTAGVEVQSEKAWEFAEEHRLARAVVFNKLDRDRAGFARSLESVHNSFGRTVVPVQIPMGEEASFRGIIDLIGEKAYVYETDGSGNFQETAIPDELQEEAAQRREELIEMVAESDDDLMEKYFEEGTLTQSELVQGLHSFFVDRSIVPAFCVSAGKNMGVKQLMDAMVELFPNPLERTPVPGLTAATEEEVELSISEDGPVTAYVFKTLADPFAGRINLVKAITGTVKSDSNLRNRTAESNERLGSVHIPQGKSYEPVAELRPGDLGAVMKLKHTATGDTLSVPTARSIVRKAEFPEPAISFAVEPKSRGDEDKIGNAIARVIEEDPSISFRRDAQTKQFLLSGTGQLHVEVTVAKLERKYGVNVILKPPKVPYRETVAGTADVHGRHKKQTGGHGQFGDCKIRMEGLPRGSGFEFKNEIFGGSIPRNFIPAVGKGGRGVGGEGVRGRVSGGGLQGHPLRRQLPRRGLLGDGLQDRGVAGLPQGHGTGQAGAAGAHHEGGGLRAGGELGRHHGRPEFPAGTDPGHGHQDRHAGGPCRSPDGGDAQLRADTDLHDGRTGQLPYGEVPLRCRSAGLRRKGDRGGQAGQEVVGAAAFLPPHFECNIEAWREIRMGDKKIAPPSLSRKFTRTPAGSQALQTPCFPSCWKSDP